jgi:hypothetical protein
MDEGEDEEELRPYQDEERWVSDDTSTYPDNGIQWFIDDYGNTLPYVTEIGPNGEMLSRRVLIPH